MEEKPKSSHFFKFWEFVTSHSFIFLIFLGVILVNFWFGERKLMKESLFFPSGGPVSEEFGNLAEYGANISYDSFSADSAALPSSNSNLNDSFVLFGDSVLAMTDPSGELLEWVPANAKIITHTVKEGETLSDIAMEYGVSVETILWANSLSKNSTIKPGDVLSFPSISGVLHKVRSGETLSSISKAYGVSIESILAANSEISEENIYVGDKLIIPGARPQAISIKRSEALSSGSFSSAQSSVGYFIAPTIGLNWGRLHRVNAVDIANACGTPVWAAASGIVQWAGYDPNWYYGNYIVISHPNGMQTLYAHLRSGSLLVGPGTPVSQGEKIAEIGNTGNTHGPTGCHLHFEVRGGSNPFARYR